MCNSYSHFVKIILLMCSFLSINSFAQDVATGPAQDKSKSAKQVSSSSTDNTRTQAEQNIIPKVETGKPLPAKKMVQDATINLHTTITGNQEQPRVLYILPWQSPTATDVDFESLDNEQKAVFGHIEREELRRELESSEEVK